MTQVFLESLVNKKFQVRLGQVNKGSVDIFSDIKLELALYFDTEMLIVLFFFFLHNIPLDLSANQYQLIAWIPQAIFCVSVISEFFVYPLYAHYPIRVMTGQLFISPSNVTFIKYLLYTRYPMQCAVHVLQHLTGNKCPLNE